MGCRDEEGESLKTVHGNRNVPHACRIFDVENLSGFNSSNSVPRRCNVDSGVEVHNELLGRCGVSREVIGSGRDSKRYSASLNML